MTYLFCLLYLIAWTTAFSQSYEDSVAPTAKLKSRFQQKAGLPPVIDSSPDLSGLPDVAGEDNPVEAFINDPKAVFVDDQGIEIDRRQPVTLPPAEPYEEEKPRDRLQLALDAIKEEIIEKSKKIAEQAKWVKDVKGIIGVYETKTEKVNGAINQLRLEVKDLYKKKKQIDNLMGQKKIQEQLENAHETLTNLVNALKTTEDHAHDINSSKSKIMESIHGLEDKLDKLKGAPPKAEKKEAAPEADLDQEADQDANADANADADVDAGQDGDADQDADSGSD